ncbi:hypothetical protein VTP01DRAFT_1468 [Rhizomucor pusillus]|uniref:uncharacterized protein n=1 Tax=Rhizomucor pusillus TaxID=4840 RepID=UPI0037442AE0
MDIASAYVSVDGLAGSYTIIALNAIVLLSVIGQAIYQRQLNARLVYILLSSASMLAANALFCSLVNSRTSAYSAVTSYTLAEYVLVSITPPFAWLVAFDVYRLVRPPNSSHSRYSFMYLGYLWAAIVIVCVIAVAGSIASILERGFFINRAQAISLYGTFHFNGFGLWAFPVFFAIQWAICSSEIKRYTSTLLVYVFLLICGVVGSTILLAVSLDQLTTLKAFSAASWANYALVQILTPVALLWAVFVGHRWQRPQEHDAHGAKTLQEGSSFQHLEA